MLAEYQKRYLKRLAHQLKPIVSIGQQGITEGVINELGTALNAHELIKLKISGDDRDDRRGYSYLTPRISKCRAPPGVCTITKSPSDLPIKALAMGEVMEMRPRLISASSSPTI